MEGTHYIKIDLYRTRSVAVNRLYKRISNDDFQSTQCSITFAFLLDGEKERKYMSFLALSPILPFFFFFSSVVLINKLSSESVWKLHVIKRNSPFPRIDREHLVRIFIYLWSNGGPRCVPVSSYRRIIAI